MTQEEQEKHDEINRKFIESLQHYGWMKDGVDTQEDVCYDEASEENKKGK